VIVLEHQWQEEESALASMVEQMAGYPAFVKPSNGGSSVGVSKVRSREDLGEAMRVAFGHDRKVVVEEAVQGREIECGVIGNDRPEASPVGEIIPGGEFYDYAAKYLEDTAQLVAPAELPDDASEAVRTRAIEAYTVLDCQGFARVDFFLPDEGDPIVNEINTLPGFTPISMFPRLWDLAGLSYRALISKLVDLGLERFRERERRHA
jgi:D-alanine-D-alanine ligase